MTRVALIEDELPALEHLEVLLTRVSPDAVVVSRLRTVRETRAWLAGGAPADLIIADIQLGDGLSLDALAEAALDVPVVFVTAYDHHLAPALAGNGIAYLLKPLSEADLRGALGKVERFERHFLGKLAALARSGTHDHRIVGRRGLDWVGLSLREVAWARVRHGATIVVAVDGAEVLVEEPLHALEARLVPAGFYRANRWYLVSMAAIRRVRSEGRGRLRLLLDPEPDEPVVVPQEGARAFREWFGIR